MLTDICLRRIRLFYSLEKGEREREGARTRRVRMPCKSCVQTSTVVRLVGGGPTGASGSDRSSRNHSLGQCPGLISALGTRAPKGGAGRSACNLPHDMKLVRPGALPRVYVYQFMDVLHSQLVNLHSSKNLFDPWHQQNQFLSEFAFHRSLLASPLVTADAGQVRPGEACRFCVAGLLEPCARLSMQLSPCSASPFHPNVKAFSFSAPGDTLLCAFLLPDGLRQQLNPEPYA